MSGGVVGVGGRGPLTGSYAGFVRFRFRLYNNDAANVAGLGEWGTAANLVEVGR